MPPRPLAASASARFSPRVRVAASRPSRWEHVRSPPSAGQTRRQRVRNIHAPPLGACLPPFRDAPCLHGGVLPPTAPSPEAVPSSLLWPHRHLAALHPRATHMIPSPRTCGRRLFSLWAERQCSRVPWPRQHPHSFRPKRGRPPPVRVAGVMCVIHPSQGSQGGSAATTPTHRRWGLSSHPFGMPLACTGVFCRAHAPSPEAVPSTLPLTSVGRCGTTQPQQPTEPATPTHRRWGLSSHPFGMFHLHPVVLRSDGTEKSTDVGYHRMTWLLIANSTLQNPDSLRSSAFAHKI